MSYMHTKVARHSIGSDTCFEDRLLILAQFDHGCFNWHITPAEGRELAAALMLHAGRLEQPATQESS